MSGKTGFHMFYTCLSVAGSRLPQRCITLQVILACCLVKSVAAPQKPCKWTMQAADTGSVK